MPEFIFPEWSDAHVDASDPRTTLLVPFGRGAIALQSHQRVVLDSGAFARSFQKMSERVSADVWMKQLAAWYRITRAQHGDRVRWCVAPDVFGNPMRTYEYWQQWHEHYPDVPVVPVIQLWPKRPRDLMVVIREAKRYPNQPIIMLSNPAGMNATAWGPLLDTMCKAIREHTGATHIHLLGAGWSLEDIARYQHVTQLDSLDSITYYLAAQRGERWCKCSECYQGNTWQNAAFHHARCIVDRGM